MATLTELLPSVAGSWADDVINAFENIVSKEKALHGCQSTNQTSISLSCEILPPQTYSEGSRKPKCYEISLRSFDLPFEYYEYNCDSADFPLNAAAKIMHRAENLRKRASKKSMSCFTDRIDAKLSVYDEDDEDGMSARSELREYDNKDWKDRKYGRVWESVEFNPSAKKDQLKSFWGMESYEVESDEQSDEDKSYNQTETVLKARSANLLQSSNVDPSLPGHGACASLTLRTAIQGCITQNLLMGDVLRIEHTETKAKDTAVYKVKLVGRTWWAAAPSPLRYCQTVVRKETKEEVQ